MSKTRIGLVGCGNWGKFILRDLVSLDCDVMVVAPGESSRANAASGGASVIVSRLAELPPVEGIVVASPTITHADIIEALLPRDVPIFTEKPLCKDAERADAIATQAPDRVFVMDKWRYHGGIEALREIARSEELGSVHMLRTIRTQWGIPHDDVDGVWILAPHDLTIGLEILGNIPAPRSATMERIGGEATTLHAVLGDHPSLVIEVSTRYPQHRREIRLQCEHGVAVLDDGYSTQLHIARGSDPHDYRKPQVESRPFDPTFPLLKELRVFVEYLHGGPKPKSSAAEGALTVRTLDALYRLAERSSDSVSR